MKQILLLLLLIAGTLSLKAQTENAVSFDNIDDFISAPNASALISGSNQLSISFWVLPLNAAPAYPDFDGFAGFRNNVDADFYVLQLTANSVEARFRNSNGVNYDIVYNGLILNTAQHFALTYDGTTLALYHNGVIASSIAAAGNIVNVNDAFYVGMLPWSPDNFYTNGRIDEVSLWNKTLSPTEIACIKNGAINPSETNLKLYYKFNQGIAGANNVAVPYALDSKGNINGVFSGLALNGNSSNFVNGVTTPNASTVAASLCPGSTYTFGTQTLTTPGNYYESFPGAGGCDSVVQLVLTQSVINTNVGQSGPIMTSQQAGAAYQWIDCSNGNATIPGAITQTYTATVNGSYAVIVTLGGCSDTSVCVNVTNVGIADIGNSYLELSPNPFSDELVIKNIHSNATFKLSVCDLAGKVIEEIKINSLTEIRISTSKWAAGTYMVTDAANGIRIRCIKY
jgi:hypothetical protein